MSSVHSKFAQALVPLLTVSLLAMGCDDSTAPSSGETAASQPAAQSPAGSQPAAPTSAGETSAGSGQTTMADTSTAPTVNWPAPGDTTTGSLRSSSVRPAFYTQQNSAPTAVGKVGTVSPTGVSCFGAPGRTLVPGQIFVSRSTGFSFYLDQRVVRKAWIYRWNANTRTWVAQPSPSVASLDLPARLSFGLPTILSGYIPESYVGAPSAGYYKSRGSALLLCDVPRGLASDHRVDDLV